MIATHREVCGRCAGRGFIEYMGARLRKKREAAGLSLREVSRQLKFSAAYICDVELNRRQATERIREFYDSL